MSLPFVHQQSLLTASSTTDLAVDLASDDWRQPVSFRASRASIEGLKIAEFNGELHHISAFANHNRYECVALGNTSKTRDKLSIIKIKGLNKFEVACEIKCPFISDISWWNSRILCCTSNGNVFMYNADPNTKKIISPSDEEKVTEYIHNNLKETRAPPPAPGKMFANKKVNKVSLNPTDDNLFITLENYNLHLWDTEQIKEPVVSKALSGYSPYYAAEWSPHSGNKLLIGGLKKSLKLIDVKLFGDSESGPKPYVWKRNNAHKDSIRDIKWNPFIPHWVATAGEDGVINVWDLRFNMKPVISLESHFNAVNKISWSSTHCDILISGGNDRQIKIWNLNVRPHHVVASIPDLSSGVLGVGYSRADTKNCFGATLSGQFVNIVLSDEFFVPLIKSRCAVDDKEGQDVEKEIFLRNFKTGFDKAYNLSLKLKETSKFEEALRTLELCYERMAPDPEAEIVQTTDNPKKLFEEELLMYSYFIPPNFPEHLSIPADPSITTKIELSKLSLELFKFVQMNAGHELIERSKEICDLVNANPDSIPTDVLYRVLKVMLNHDYIKSLQFAQDLGEIYKAKNKWNDFINFAKLILRPSIFDSGDDSKVPPLFSNLLMNPSEILDQIDLLKESTKILWNANPIEQKKFIEYVENNRPKVILSSSLQRIYLNALLHSNQFSKYYNYSIALQKTVEGSPFFEILSKSMKTEWYSRLQDYVQECQVGLQSSSEEPWEAVKFYPSVIEIVKILETCDSLPSNVTSYLPANLNQLSLDLENALLELKKVNTSNSNKTKIQASKEAKKILTELESILKGKQSVGKQWKKEVNNLMSMLKSF